MSRQRKIPGTESGRITTPEEFERYARYLADDTVMSRSLAQRLLAEAAEDVNWPVFVTVHTHDGRPAYVGTVPARTRVTDDRLPVRNSETGETVQVPVSALAPVRTKLGCDCEGCLDVWVGTRLGTGA